MLNKLTIRKEGLEPTNIEQIETFENQIGYKLPNDYKKILLQYNGAKTGSEIFKFENFYFGDPDDKSETEFWLERFKPLRKIIEWGIDEDEENSSRKYILISLLECSDTGIYLSLNEETHGYIYWMDYPHEGYFHKIANNFIEFLDGFIYKPWYSEDYDENGDFVETDI